MPATSSGPAATASAGRIGERAEQTGQQMGEDLGREGGRVVGGVRQEFAKMAEQRREQAATLLHDVAEALQAFTSRLDEKGHGQVARYAGMAADSLERMSSELPSRDLGDSLRRVESFARERPALFFGTLFAVGFAATRFLRASSDAAQRTETQAIADVDPDTGRTSRSFDAPGTSPLEPRSTQHAV